MNVVFVVTSFWAYGELLIAKAFADRIKEDGNNVLFIIPPSHEKSLSNLFNYVMFIPNSRNINKIIFQTVQEEFAPDLVILSDFLNYFFADRHYGITTEDLDVFKCKIATFDNFDWNLKRTSMDTYGYISDIPKKVSVESYGDRIIACPLGTPTLAKKEGEHRFSLFSMPDYANQKQKLKLRKEYADKYSIDKKIILVSNAKWQENYIQNEKIDKFIELANLIFHQILMRLAETEIVISIGEKNGNSRRYPQYITLDSMPSNEFDRYVQMSDLYIGRNITSTSMIRIALSGIPCVNIENSRVSLCEEDLNKLSEFTGIDIKNIDKIYRFMMFPVGWYEFLKPLMDGNPYSEIVKRCELFDVESTFDVIQDLLYNEQTKVDLQNRISNMNTMLEQLQAPSDIIKLIVQK